MGVDFGFGRAPNVFMVNRPLKAASITPGFPRLGRQRDAEVRRRLDQMLASYTSALARWPDSRVLEELVRTLERLLAGTTSPSLVTVPLTVAVGRTTLRYCDRSDASVRGQAMCRGAWSRRFRRCTTRAWRLRISSPIQRSRRWCGLRASLPVLQMHGRPPTWTVGRLPPVGFAGWAHLSPHSGHTTNRVGGR